MNSGEEHPDRVEVAMHGLTGYAKVIGRGSFKVSASMKDFGMSLLQRGGQTLVLDMDQCIGMDSTFMGVIAGLCVRFRREREGHVLMINTSAKVQGLLAVLGLDRLVQVHVPGQTPADIIDGLPRATTQTLVAGQQSPLEAARTMLTAHEQLAELSPDNALRFRDVVDYLRDDIKKHSS